MIADADAATYHVQSDGRKIVAANDRQGLSASWSADTGSLKLESRDLSRNWTFAMSGSPLLEKSSSDGGKLTLHRENFNEWFINGPSGLEHGFNLSTRPASAAAEGFEIAMTIETSLAPEVQEDGRAIHFRDGEGDEVLYYRGLLVLDAAGRSLPAAMQIEAGATEDAWQLAIHVDDRNARYPLVIDPVFTTLTAALTSQPQDSSEIFGAALAMCGNELAVGVPSFDEVNPGENNLGAVDLFRYYETSRTWSRVKRILPTGFSGSGGFGTSIDLDGDTLVVGSRDEPGGGAAYVFQRDLGGTNQWGQVTRLTAAGINTGGAFGASVAVSGGMLAVGAPFKNNPTGGGGVYVSFRDAAGTWPAPALLDGFAPANGDQLGYRLEAEGTRIAATATFGETLATPASAGVVVMYEFVMNPDGTPLSHSTTLLNDSTPAAMALFGESLALEGDLLAVGSPHKTHSGITETGTVALFRRDPVVGWIWQAELRAADAKADDHFGRALGLSGDTLAIGTPMFDSTVDGSGATYLFEKGPDSATWNFIERLEPPAKEFNCYYGLSVAMSGDCLAVGIPFDDQNAMNQDTGSVQTLVRSSAAWQALSAPLVIDTSLDPVALDGSGLLQADGDTRTGHAVAIDRGRAAVGMPGYVDAGVRRGAVSMLTMNAGGEDEWASDDFVASPVAQADQRFGESVAMCGEWLLVGAPGYDMGGLTDAGRAYLFRYGAAGGWNFYMTLDLPFLTAGAEFGTAVALSSRWAFVGAPGMSHAFAFDRYVGGTDAWQIATILDESAGGGRFGERIALDGNLAAIAAPQREGLDTAGKFDTVLPGAGQVKVYQTMASGGNTTWQAVKTLPQAGVDGDFGQAQGHFGLGLALNRGMLIVGEPGYAANAGRAKVHAINQGGGGTWGEVATLAAASPQAGDLFGQSVALGARWIFAGAPGEDVGGKPTGAVFIWDRLSPGGAAKSRVLFPRGMDADEFGFALACSDNDLIAGAPGLANNSDEAETGSYAIYRRQSSAWHSSSGPLGGNAGIGDSLGHAVAMDGEFMIAGAPYDAPSGVLAAGSAHLYRRNALAASGWIFVKTLQANDLDIGANFGYAVDIHGDTIVIGAPGWDNRGAGYVFHRNSGGPDAWGQQKRIDLAAVSATDDFGAAVAIHDDLIAIGSPNDNVGVLDGGSVRIFNRHAGATNGWGLIDKISKTVPEAFDFFGSAVDLCDGRLLVGVALSDERGDASGAAYLYDRPTAGAEWVLQDTLSPANNDAGDRLGCAVALDGATAVVGGSGDNTHAANSGAAWIFRDSGGGTDWQVERKITPGNYEAVATLAELQFGAAVAIRGDEVVIGSPGYDATGVLNCGAGHVFQRNQTHANAWERVAKFSGQSAGSTARAGKAVAIGQGFIALGAPEADQGTETDAGYLLFFGDNGSAYLEWARVQFGNAAVGNAALEASLWGAEADPDHDGLANAIEAFMATDPERTQARETDTGVTRDAEGGLRFRYRMGKETHGAIGRVTWSRSLSEWRGGDLLDGEIEFQQRVFREGVDYFIMEARVASGYLINEPRFFMRLEVEVP